MRCVDPATSGQASVAKFSIGAVKDHNLPSGEPCILQALCHGIGDNWRGCVAADGVDLDPNHLARVEQGAPGCQRVGDPGQLDERGIEHL
jgi:hypothetical protein